MIGLSNYKGQWIDIAYDALSYVFDFWPLAPSDPTFSSDFSWLHQSFSAERHSYRRSTIFMSAQPVSAKASSAVPLMQARTAKVLVL